MSEIVESIKVELLKRCEAYKEKHGYDFWNDHIKYVVKNSIELAKKYGADVEIVELGALLHDIAMPSEFGPREEHNVYGVQIAEELLTQLNYPEDRKERVKECVLRHRGSKSLPRNTIEEGTEFVKKKLERDFNKLSDRTKIELKDRYENIMRVLFVDK